MAVDEGAMVTSVEGPIHVSFKQVKNTIPPQRVKLLVGNYNFMKAETGTDGVAVQLKFDPQAHPDWAKRQLNERFWLTPNAINMYLSFIVACGISPEMLREEPVDPPQFNPDGSPITACVYSVEDQLKSIFGAAVMADIIEEEYESTAADGVTKEKRWRNTVPPRGYSKAH